MANFKQEVELSDLSIYKYLTGEMTEEELLHFEQQKAKNDLLQQRIEEIERIKVPPLNLKLIAEKQKKNSHKITRKIVKFWKIISIAALFLFVLNIDFFLENQSQKNASLAQKGSGNWLLIHKDLRYESGAMIQVQEKDDLYFEYRSTENVYYQIFYKDDQKDWALYFQNQEDFPLEKTNHFQGLEKRIQIEQGWGNEKIVILFFSKRMNSKKVFECLNQKNQCIYHEVAFNLEFKK